MPQKTKELPQEFLAAAKDKSGTIYHDFYDDGVRVIVMRSNASINAYFGVPITHPLAGHSYDNIPVDVHGGLTFSHEGDDKYLPSGFWWYGADYAHSGDYCFYDIEYNLDHKGGDKAWTPEEVKEDIWSAIYDFSRLLKLAESIHTNALGWHK